MTDQKDESNNNNNNNNMEQQSSPTSSSSSSGSGSGHSNNNKKSPLRDPIKTFVNKTNSALATFEEKTDSIYSSVAPQLSKAKHQTNNAARTAVQYYDSRKHYGPQIVAGSAVALGGVTALRRGKVPGLAVGFLAGTMAYVAVYGLTDVAGSAGDSSTESKK